MFGIRTFHDGKMTGHHVMMVDGMKKRTPLAGRKPQQSGAAVVLLNQIRPRYQNR